MEPETVATDETLHNPSGAAASGRPLGLIARLKEAAAEHGEQALAELPATLRRVRTFLLVAAISLPLFLIGVLVILALLVH
jgi:hypothetical protein